MWTANDHFARSPCGGAAQAATAASSPPEQDHEYHDAPIVVFSRGTSSSSGSPLQRTFSCVSCSSVRARAFYHREVMSDLYAEYGHDMMGSPPSPGSASGDTALLRTVSVPLPRDSEPLIRSSSL